MGLVTTEQTAASTAAAPAEQPKILLELATYERYNRLGVLYVRHTDDGRPQVYSFTPAQAAILLQEVDEVDQRPIWRRPLKRLTPQQRAEQAMRPAVFDATRDRVKTIETDDTARLGLDNTVRRIEDGDDSEIQDVIAGVRQIEGLDEPPELPSGEVTQV